MSKLDPKSYCYSEPPSDPPPPLRVLSKQEPLPVTAETLAKGAGEWASDSKYSFFEIIHHKSLPGAVEAADFVEGLLLNGGASVIYGASNTGKTFEVLDIAAAVASGRPFRGELEVERGAVVYVALEGRNGAINRIVALRKERLLSEDDPFFLIFEQVALLEPGHAEKLARSVAEAAKDCGFPVKLVILDTMARAMAGGDENSGADMTSAVKAIDAVRAATGAHVCVVHHCGKDQARGARGHSSLRAAVDTELEVSRNENEKIATVRVTKQRDLPAGDPMPFSLKVVELGTDRRGRPITSCVVHHEDSIMATKVGKPGRPQTTSVAHLLSMLPQPSTTAWQKFARNNHEVTTTPFYNALRQIQLNRAAEYSKKDGWTLPAANFGSDFA